MCALNGRQCGTRLEGRHHTGQAGQVHLETLGVKNLRHQAAISQGRAVTKTVAGCCNALGITPRRILGQHAFEAFQPRAHPVVVPLGFGGFIRLHVAHQVRQHPQVVQRMHLASHCLRQRAHPGTPPWVCRQQRRLWMGFIQKLDDGHGLCQHLPIHLQSRHQLLRGYGGIGWLQLFTPYQVHRHIRVVQPLELQRHPHAVRCRGAKVVVEFHAHSITTAPAPSPPHSFTFTPGTSMILELADIRIHPGQQAAFDEAIQRGLETVISQAKGFQGFKVNKGIESPERYILQIFWATLENHTVDFRESPLFTQWRAIVGPFFASPPVVEHFELVTKSA